MVCRTFVPLSSSLSMLPPSTPLSQPYEARAAELRAKFQLEMQSYVPAPVRAVRVPAVQVCLVQSSPSSCLLLVHDCVPWHSFVAVPSLSSHFLVVYHCLSVFLDQNVCLSVCRRSLGVRRHR